MAGIAHEVVFREKGGDRVFYLHRRMDKTRGPSFFLKEGKKNKLVRLHGNLPAKIREALDGRGLKLSSSSTPLSVEKGMKSYNYLPLVELPKGEKPAGSDAYGKRFVTINIDDDFTDWLDNVVLSADIYRGVHAFFDEHMGRGARGVKAKILKENPTPIRRAILLALHRMRIGAGWYDTYNRKHIGKISPDNETAVKKRVMGLDVMGLQRLADILNKDEKMAILRKKHNMPEFTVEELLDIQAKAKRGRNE